MFKFIGANHDNPDDPMTYMKDNFSAQSSQYAQYRPMYPIALYEHILQFVKERNTAWDCGTGNGQAATVLASYFSKVYATDISEKQLEHAAKNKHVIYSQQPAEKTNFNDNTFDLITVAQAVHWFDFETFYREVNRTSKNGGLLAVIGYGLINSTGPLQDFIQHFYHDITGPYWDPERKWIDENYLTIPFPFEELPGISLDIEFSWNKDAFTGYLRTWSAVQHYIKANQRDPVSALQQELEQAWGNDDEKYFAFPVLFRLGRIVK